MDYVFWSLLAWAVGASLFALHVLSERDDARAGWAASEKREHRLESQLNFTTEACRSLEREVESMHAAQRDRDTRNWDDDDVLAAMELDLLKRTPRRQ